MAPPRVLWLVDRLGPDPLLRNVEAGLPAGTVDFVEWNHWPRADRSAPSLARPGKAGLPVAVARLARATRSTGADLVHAHGHLPSLIATAASFVPGAPPLVLTRHHNIEHELLGKPGHVRLESWEARRADRVVAVSTAVRDTLVRHGVDPARVRVVHHGIDWDRYRPDPEHVAAWRNRATGGPLLVSVGRIDPMKDHRTLLDAFELVWREHPGARLVLAGLGATAEVDGLTADLRRRSLTGAVELLGWVDDVPSLVAAADVYVQSSVDESFGLSVLEAVGLGVPVAVTTPGGLRDVVGPAMPELAPGDAAGLAARALAVLADLPAARTAATPLAADVHRRFDVQAAAGALLEVYRELLR